MKKLFLLTKTLLVAVMLCVGASNAWATVTETVVVNCDFSEGETLFTNVNRMGISNSENLNVKFTCANNSANGYSLATYDFSSAIGEDATAIKVEFAYWIPNSNSAYYRYFTLGQANMRTGFAKSTYSTSGAMFGMGLKRGKWNGAGNTVNFYSVNNGYTSQTGTNVLGAWARAEVYIDFSTKKISYKITNVTNTETYFSADNVDYMDSDASYCNQIDFYDCANDEVSYLDNLVITKYKDDSKVATTYTVRYQNASGTNLKDAAVYDTYVGDSYTASSADMATFYNGDSSKKYVYASGNTSSTAVATAASNVITLVFNEYDKIAYTVTAKDGETTLGTLASGNAYTDGSTNAYWSKYINANDKWYVADETTYGAAITTASTDVAYTETNNIDYFFECESMTYSSTYNTYNGPEVSNGVAKTLGANGATVKTNSTIAAGVYTLTLNGKKWDSKTDSYEVAYSTDDTNWIVVGNITYGSDEEGEKTLSGVIIPANSYIRLRTLGGSQTPRRYLDYLAVKKTASLPSTENIVVTSAGYATYVSNYNLDFTSATTKAYKVNVADEAIATLTEVSKVPAKTPVLLYVAGGNGSGEAIPVTTDAVDAVTGNNLVAGAGVAVAYDNGDDKYNYVLDNQDDVVGFYKAADLTVPVGRAYLQTTFNVAGAGARGLRMVFAGDITGVNEAKAEAAAQKDGKFVINGQLVIKKNGKMFNAAGVQMK